MRYISIALLIAALALAGCEQQKVTPVGSSVTGPTTTATTPTTTNTTTTTTTTPPPAGDALPTGVAATDPSKPADVAMASAPINADGKLNEAAWNNATAFAGFVSGKGQPAGPVATRVLVTYDKDNLYVAVINDEPATAKLVAKADPAKRDDKAIWGGDDHDEIYIDATAEKSGQYSAFFVTSKNAIYDRRQGGEEDWDGEWQHGVNVIDGKAWVAELAIPWKTLDVKAVKPGHKLGLMVARSRTAGAKGEFYLVNCQEEAKDTSCYPTLVLK